MTTENGTGKCRDCQRPIYWFKSKAGKNYPCDSDNRRDFHKCNRERYEPTDEPQRMGLTPQESLLIRKVITADIRVLAGDKASPALDMQLLNAAIEKLRAGLSA